MTIGAFFSYTRTDDQHDGGYLTEMRRALASEVSVQTGEPFLIFQDREDVLWGQRWKERIEESLDATTILLPVLTPSFFKSDSCRAEVERFLERENRLGRSDLILPIYYVNVFDLDTDSSDSLKRVLASRQYVDWRPLRFEPFDSPEVRRAIAQLGYGIVQALSRAPEHEAQASAEGNAAGESDPAEGFLELVAEAEEAMPVFNQVMLDFVTELQALGELATAATEELNSADAMAKPASAKLVVTRKLAKEFDGPASRMEELSAEYIDQLARVDAGVRAMIGRIAGIDSEDDIEAARGLLSSLDELVGQASLGLGALEELSHALLETSHLSSTLRPPIRRMDRALQQMVPSIGTFESWRDDLAEAIEAVAG